MPYHSDFSIAEALGLDASALKRLAVAYAAYGRLRTPEMLPSLPRFYPALKRHGDKPPGRLWRWPPQLRAGYLARAASYWAAIDPSAARECYADAAAFTFDEREAIQTEQPGSEGYGPTQRRTRHTEAELRRAAVTLRALPLSLLGKRDVQKVSLELTNNREAIAAYSTPEVIRVVLTSASAVSLLQRESFINKWQDAFPTASERFAAVPVGRLGIPLSFYSNFADAAAEHSNSKARTPEMIHRWLVQLDGRLNERLRQAQSDGRHWRLLYSSLLPLEPELLVLFYSWVGEEAEDVPDVTGRQLDRYSPALRAYFVAAMRLRRV